MRDRMQEIRHMSRLFKLNFHHLTGNIKLFLKWGIFSTFVGIIVGAASSAFAFCLKEVTKIREAYPQMIFFLPLAGIVIVLLYSLFQYKNDKGTNLVISSIHSPDKVPFRMAPLIFITTLITHLFGGSAGREGAALQLGGAIGQKLADVFHFDERDQRIVVMCGMSAAFSAVFGTPIAASIFAMEIISVGVMYYVALVPCVFSSLVASKFATHFGIEPHVYDLVHSPKFHLVPGLKIILLALLCAALSVIFCECLHSLGDIYRTYLKNPYLRIVVSSLIIIGLTLLFHTTDYMGAGVSVIGRAIAGDVRPEAFLLKIVFTALTLEAGFKGGEIVPSFFIGATFGCLFGQLAGISPSLCAGVGMISVFCGVTNCPITSILIAFELFGYEAVPYFLLAVSVSYLMSGYYGLYNDQTIVYSKYRPQYINRKTRK